MRFVQRKTLAGFASVRAQLNNNDAYEYLKNFRGSVKYENSKVTQMSSLK
jgi:hypothetical protein